MKLSTNIVIAIIFLILTIAFLVLLINNQSFLYWTYNRHQNQLSWYIRPLFLIPFCYFAYKHNWTGIAGTIFFLFTSMFWFPAPSSVSPEVKQFLELEKEWLLGNWTYSEISMMLLVPLSFFLLGAAFWKRSLWIGITLISLIAISKIIWSISLGNSGRSILLPAIVGLIICLTLTIVGFKFLEKRNSKKKI